MSAPRRPAAPRPGAGRAPESGEQAVDRRRVPGQAAEQEKRPATLRPAGGAPRPTPPRVRPTRSGGPKSSASRPASARPAARTGSGGGRGGGAETVQQRVPRLFTVRALVMLIVVAVAFILVFPTLRQYLNQQVSLQQSRADVAAAQQRNEDLQAELDRWSDPAYVEAQARERLAFVMPGEQALRVADPETVPESTPSGQTGDGPAVQADPTRPWYAQIWDSVQVAGVAGTDDTQQSSSGENVPQPTATP
ncbi:FtsB family cell division protein [Cellulomonas taurus]|uniref:FtsB family cell division protein n=1 Tax=Cellulomonas taurus TaxID=2729175 RepID=UPI001FE8559B|nr:septum formation initiator family protein [Cellulomonas taurus]